MPILSIARPTLLCLLACLTGCASMASLNFSKGDFPKAGPKNPVVRILGLWQAADGVAGSQSSRGFSGQILFFANDAKLPAQVDGEVLIYVFDDQGTEEEQIKPIHEFKFPAESWNALLCHGPLGATYNVFIPYTRPGFHQANCTVRLRYTPKQGPMIYSDMVHVVLPGTAKTKSVAAADKSAVPAASAAAPVAATQGASSRRRPQVQGITDAISLDNAREPVRPRGAELTDEDRQRLIEAAKARLVEEKKRKIELAGLEESAGAEPAPAESGWKRRPPNVLLENDEGSAESQDTQTVTGTSVQKRSSKGHILDDENDDENDDGEVEFPNQPTHAMDDGVE